MRIQTNGRCTLAADRRRDGDGVKVRQGNKMLLLTDSEALELSRVLVALVVVRDR